MIVGIIILTTTRKKNTHKTQLCVISPIGIYSVHVCYSITEPMARYWFGSFFLTSVQAILSYVNACCKRSKEAHSPSTLGNIGQTAIAFRILNIFQTTN